MQRITKEVFSDGETRYLCEECRNVKDGSVEAQDWRPMLKFDPCSNRYTQAIFTSMRQAESFIRNHGFVMDTDVVKHYGY